MGIEEGGWGVPYLGRVNAEHAQQLKKVQEKRLGKALQLQRAVAMSVLLPRAPQPLDPLLLQIGQFILQLQTH